MTDRERLRALLADWGISPGDDGSFISLEATKGNVGGQYPLNCLFQFDESGAFVSVGVYLD